MLKKFEWPTAIVVVVCVAGYVTLAALDKEVPHWLTAALSALGTLVAAAAPKLVKGEPVPSESAIQINHNEVQ